MSRLLSSELRDFRNSTVPSKPKSGTHLILEMHLLHSNCIRFRYRSAVLSSRRVHINHKRTEMYPFAIEMNLLKFNIQMIFQIWVTMQADKKKTDKKWNIRRNLHGLDDWWQLPRIASRLCPQRIARTRSRVPSTIKKMQTNRLISDEKNLITKNCVPPYIFIWPIH